jgi:hypothetical protein
MINIYPKKNMSSHPLRMVYFHMMHRCYWPEDPSYHCYGGRGIEVCDQWKRSSKSFYKWALPLWEKGLQIDRINNDGNYSPENCRFVTAKENCRNSRNFYPMELRQQIAQDITTGGKISRIAKKYNISRPTIYSIRRELCI